MKHLVRTIFCGALLLVDLVFTGGAASAHTMPESETALRYSCAQGERAVTAEFELGMLLKEARDLMGDGFEEKEGESGGVRFVDYKYRDVTFTGSVWGEDRRLSGEIPIYSIRCRSRSFKTPSGFSVGDPYEKVRAMYGEGKALTYNGLEYDYQMDVTAITFKVDDEGTIKEIRIYQTKG